MTKNGLERIVTVWQRRLRLDNYVIKIDWTKQPAEHVHASIQVSDDYETANIRFAESFRTWTDQYANEVVVHELLHVFEKGTRRVTEACEATLNVDAFQVLMAWYTHAAENWVDRLSLILVDLGGVA